MARKSMHTGGNRPLRIRAFTNGEFAHHEEYGVVDKVFNPEASKTDGNPFSKEQRSDEQPVEVAPLDYDSMTVEELKALLRARSLPVAGAKADLIARLIEADTPSEEAVEVDEVAPSEEAATSKEGVSENNAENSRPDEPLGEQPSGGA